MDASNIDKRLCKLRVPLKIKFFPVLSLKKSDARLKITNYLSTIGMVTWIVAFVTKRKQLNTFSSSPQCLEVNYVVLALELLALLEAAATCWSFGFAGTI